MPIVKTVDGKFYNVDESQEMSLDQVKAMEAELAEKLVVLQGLTSVPAEQVPVSDVPTANVNGEQVPINADGTVTVETPQTTVTVDTTPEQPAPETPVQAEVPQTEVLPEQPAQIVLQ